VKLLVPYLDKLCPADERLMRLAEFLGIGCESLPLAGNAESWTNLRSADSGESTVVVNPAVIEQWMKQAGAKDESALSDLATSLVSRFPYLLIHAAQPAPFHAKVVSVFSGGALKSVEPIASGLDYQVSPNSKDFCEAFAGLRFGPANAALDCVFSPASRDFCGRSLMTVGDGILLASIPRRSAEVVFVGGEMADLNLEIGDAPVVEYFSQLLPHAMALRHIFGEQSWRPSEAHASVIIDDPLLRPNYGFLNFDHLLGLMKQHNFHTTVAFIPYNFRRNSRRVIKMFQENTDRFSLCFHGNDHTGAEFASTDTALLNTMLQIAEQRMSQHHKTTGLDCHRIMVFPQGNFSSEAMAVLNARNFDAAVNTTSHPRNEAVRLTLSEIAQPAVLRYGSFPLFLRKPSLQTQREDVAFNLFFGKPTLIVEHHDVFEHPERLVDVAARINAVAPGIGWSGLGRAVSRSVLRRRTLDGVSSVRVYGRTASISSSSGSVERFEIEWNQIGLASSVAQVLRNGQPCDFDARAEGRIALSAELAPGASETFAVVHRNPHAALEGLGLQRKAWAFLRRRLSEVRDNYVSKNPPMRAAAKMLRRRMVH
jgi:hypothetical protein